MWVNVSYSSQNILITVIIIKFVFKTILLTSNSLATLFFSSFALLFGFFNLKVSLFGTTTNTTSIYLPLMPAFLFDTNAILPITFTILMALPATFSNTQRKQSKKSQEQREKSQGHSLPNHMIYNCHITLYTCNVNLYLPSTKYIFQQ